MTVDRGLITSGRSVYGRLAQELHTLGVSQFFGLIGEDTAPLAAELRRAGASYRPARRESGAVAMADGYAWATGQMGVAVISRGPGLTNAGTAARTAVRGVRNVLLIAGAPPVEGGWRPDPKQIDQAATAAAFGLGYFEARTSQEVLSTLHAAVAASGEGRASLLAVASDVLNGPATAEDSIVVAEQTARPGVAPTPSDVAAVLDVLEGCERPLILAGRGAVEVDARDVLQDLALQARALLGTTLAKDLFRDHPSDIGLVGGFTSDPARPVLADVAGIIAFGASLNSFTAINGRLAQGKRIVQIDSDPLALGRHLPLELGVCADARLAAQALLDVLCRRPQLALTPMASGITGPLYSGADESLPDRVDPRIVATVLAATLGPDWTIVVDGGGNMHYAGRFIRVFAPDRFRLSTDFGSVGMGLGIAIGVAVGRREEPTVLWVGDGGLVMGLAELETVARCRVPLTIVVMNDGAFGAERSVLKRAGVPSDLADYAPVDLPRSRAGSESKDTR